jgi:ABC-type amino acid transport substrate-binding protein
MAQGLDFMNRILFSWIALAVLGLGNAQAETEKTMPIATKVSAPFAFRASDGNWTGISIELWDRIARELKLPEPQYTEASLEKLLEQVENRKVAAGVAAISVTAQRERRMDFSHPYFRTGLGVAVSAQRGGSVFSSLVSKIFSVTMLKLIVGVLFSLSLIGIAFWLLERRRHPLYKDTGIRKGVGLGFWWATTVLLGNKGVLPSSALARFLVLMGMLTSIIVLVTFTGTIASLLTVSQLERDIRQPEDLRHLRVVTVANTTSEEYLRNARIAFWSVSDLKAAADTIVEGSADAVVYDAPVLKFLGNEEYRDRIRALNLTFQPQQYAIALAQGSELREPVNRALLRIRADPWWEDMLYRYLGK